MARQANGGSGGRQENKRWSLIHVPRFLTVFLVISMIHVTTSQNKKRNLDLDPNIIRSPRNVKRTGQTNPLSNRVCNTKECIDAANKIKSSMNLSVDPCDDFYEYACGRWPINNPFPSGYSYYSLYQTAENQIDKYNIKKLKAGALTVQGASKELQQMPSDLFNSCLDVATIKKLGKAPLIDRIRELGGWSMSGNWDEDTWDFNKNLLFMHKLNPHSFRGPLFSTNILPGGTNKTSWIMQAGPVLVKQHYLNLSSKTMLAYKQLIIDVVVLLGGTPKITAKKADEIIRFEAQLANVSLTTAEWQPLFVTSKITLGQLQREVPGFNWIDYYNKLFAPSTIPESEVISMQTLPYLKNMTKIIQNTPKRVLANYMVWYIIRQEIKWLSAPFKNAELRYKEKTTGTTSDKDISKKCVDSALEDFDDVISAAYVKEHQAQLAGPINMAKQLLNKEIQAFKDNVRSLTWLDNPTKIGVFEKVDAMKTKIGYPAYLLDSTKMTKIFEKFRGLTTSKKTFYKNKVSILKNKRQHILKTFREPMDNTLWLSSPLKVNALNNVLTNTMTFTATMIQPPFLYPEEFLRAYTLGKFGLVVGHEIMHGFATVGRPLDKDGKQTNWWSKSSLLEFDKKLKCFEKQYSAYKILGKWPINGKNTAEENVADSDALKIALKAYYSWAEQNPSQTWLLQGVSLTNEQLFYVGFAQHFCSSRTEESRREHNVGATHTDEKFRIVGSLSNSCEFAKAFQCKTNSPMNPVNKCYLWSKEGLSV